MSFTGTVTASVGFTESALSDTEQASISIGQSVQAIFGDGVTAGNINAVWQDTRTLGTGAADTLDFSPTAASGKTGASGVVTFARVKFVYIASLAANTTNLTVTKGATGLDIFTGTTPGLGLLPPGGFFVYCNPSAAGIAVTGAASDTLVITNSAGASATYTIIVAGGLT